MQSPKDPNTPRPPASSKSNAFAPEFLERVQGQDEPVTAGEADLAGPWKRESVPGHPGAVAVLRAWENLDDGDLAHAVFLFAETARLFTVVLPLLAREPLFHLGEHPDPDAPLPGGYPVTAVYGDQGPAVVGWLSRYEPEAVALLHVLEGLARTPKALAEVALASGGVALTQVGRFLAAQSGD